MAATILGRALARPGVAASGGSAAARLREACAGSGALARRQRPKPSSCGSSHSSSPDACSCSRWYLCAGTKWEQRERAKERARDAARVRTAVAPVRVAVVEADEVLLRRLIEEGDRALVPQARGWEELIALQ